MPVFPRPKSLLYLRVIFWVMVIDISIVLCVPRVRRLFWLSEVQYFPVLGQLPYQKLVTLEAWHWGSISFGPACQLCTNSQWNTPHSRTPAQAMFSDEQSESQSEKSMFSNLMYYKNILHFKYVDMFVWLRYVCIFLHEPTRASNILQFTMQHQCFLGWGLF